MFDPAEETEPGWDLEIAEDTKAECSKYGPVLHAYVDSSSKGFVYLKVSSWSSRVVLVKISISPSV